MDIVYNYVFSFDLKESNLVVLKDLFYTYGMIQREWTEKQFNEFRSMVSGYGIDLTEISRQTIGNIENIY